jgi:hypothetical protein
VVLLVLDDPVEGAQRVFDALHAADWIVGVDVRGVSSRAPDEQVRHPRRASGTDGTASLANRDFGRVARANGPKVVFCGAAQHANEAAGAGYFADSSRESTDTGTRWRRELNSNFRFCF